MATTTLKGFNKNTLTIISKGLQRPIENAKTFFQTLGSFLHAQQIPLTFKMQGKRGGHRKWVKFSQKTLHPYNPITNKYKTHKWNYRYGTDGSKSRYSSSSKLLQASGSFMRSFKTMSVTNKKMIYGTNYDKAKDIMKRGREVIFVTTKDYRLYTNMFRYFIDKEIKF